MTFLRGLFIAGGRAFLTLLFSLVLIFLLLRALPGDALTTTLRESGASVDVIAARRETLGLNEPLLEQLARYGIGVVRGDLGVSLVSGQSVTDQIAEALPETLALAALALAVGMCVGLAVTYALTQPRRTVRALAHLWASLTLSTPIYWLGTLALFVFSAQLAWLPASGSSIQASLLPVLLLGAQVGAAIGQVGAVAVAEAQAAAFHQTAQAKGLHAQSIWFRHLLRYAAPQLISVIGLQTGYLMGGAAITEAVFNRPGIGRLLVSAVLNGDAPVVQGIALWTAAIFVVTRALSQLAMSLANPRLNSDGIG